MSQKYINSSINSRFWILPASLLAALISVTPWSFNAQDLTAIAQVPDRQTNPQTNPPTKPNKTSPTAKPATNITEISPSKRALIRELLEITETTKNANQLIDARVRSDLPKLLSALLKDAPFLNSDRPDVQSQLSDLISRMAGKYRDRVIQKIDISQLIEQVSYPVYDQYFTESELRDIISFYKSDTGKKAIQIMPQVLGDSIARTNEILLPKMATIMTEIIAEELLNVLANPNK